MRSLTYSGVAALALMASQPVWAAIDSGVGAPPAPAKAINPLHNDDTRAPMPEPLHNDDTRGSVPVPRSTIKHYASYQRVGYGYQLPRDWMSPQYFIADYRAYGLDRPARGFGWSHYYDDVVLTDQWGRVYDVADARGGGYDRGRGFGSRDTDGIAGGVAGAAVGAVAGNVIAGAGSRLAGSLIGGGVGALAGLAVEAALSKHHRRDRHHDDDRAFDEGNHYGHGAHWGGYQAQAWSYGGCNCGSGGEMVTTTTVTHSGGGGGYMVPRRTVWYENVYEAAPTKYHVRAAAPAPTKYHERAAAPAPVPADGKEHERTRLHTKTINR